MLCMGNWDDSKKRLKKINWFILVFYIGVNCFLLIVMPLMLLVKLVMMRLWIS